MNRFWIVLMVAFLAAPLTAPAQEAPAQEAPAQEAPAPAQDEAAIRKAVESYVKAFNSGNAKAVAAFWSPDAVYTSRTTGEEVVGRDKIEEQFTALFEGQKDIKLDVTTQSVQFISPNVAVEHGSASVIEGKDEPNETDYTAVYVRRDGAWLLDRVSERDVPVVKSHYEQLKPLQWMIGNWVDEDESGRISTECKWTRNKNFITRSFTVAIEDQIDMAGMQIIGWDPAAKQIRSWVFDSDGGFFNGVWTKKGNRWTVQKKGILADGRKASAVHIIKYVDDDTFTLQAISRVVDGEFLPNIDEVRVVRGGNAE